MKKAILLSLVAFGFVALASGCSGDDVHNISWWQKQDSSKIESFLDRCEQRQNFNTECKNAYKALKMKQAGVNDTPKSETNSDEPETD